jgi:hypothetical protein
LVIPSNTNVEMTNQTGQWVNEEEEEEEEDEDHVQIEPTDP